MSSNGTNDGDKTMTTTTLNLPASDLQYHAPGITLSKADGTRHTIQSIDGVKANDDGTVALTVTLVADEPKTIREHVTATLAPLDGKPAVDRQRAATAFQCGDHKDTELQAITAELRAMRSEGLLLSVVDPNGLWGPVTLYRKAGRPERTRTNDGGKRKPRSKVRELLLDGERAGKFTLSDSFPRDGSEFRNETYGKESFIYIFGATHADAVAISKFLVFEHDIRVTRWDVKFGLSVGVRYFRGDNWDV